MCVGRDYQRHPRTEAAAGRPTQPVIAEEGATRRRRGVTPAQLHPGLIQGSWRWSHLALASHPRRERGPSLDSCEAEIT